MAEITKELIAKAMEKCGIQFQATAYAGAQGVGIVYGATIESLHQKTYRLMEFKEIREILEFCLKLKCADQVILEHPDDLTAPPKMYKKGKEVTLDFAKEEYRKSEERKKQKDKEKEEFDNYVLSRKSKAESYYEKIDETNAINRLRNEKGVTYSDALAILKEYDESNDEDIYEFVKQRIEKVQEKWKQEQKKENEREDKEYKENHPLTKQKRLFEKLKEQYEKNYTQEQKDALLIYNSYFFDLISQITSIEGYEELTNEEIWNKTPADVEYRIKNEVIRYVKFMLDCYSKKKDDRICKLFEKVITPEIITKYLKSMELGDEEYENIIGSLREQIDIIKDIPPTAIILPEDITVYRGVLNYDGIDDNVENPNRGLIVSTSTNIKSARTYAGMTDYYSGKGYVYKIELKKGTPVMIFLEKIGKKDPPTPIDIPTTKSFLETPKLLIVQADYSKDEETAEIAINSMFMKEIVVDKSTLATKRWYWTGDEFVDKGAFDVKGCNATWEVNERTKELIKNQKDPSDDEER